MMTIGMMTVAAPAMGTTIPSVATVPPVTLAAIYGGSGVDVGVVVLTAVALLLVVARIVRPPRVRRIESRPPLRMAA